MPDTAHLTSNERRKLLSALSEIEGTAEIVAGPRSAGRPRIDETESLVKGFLKGQELLVIKVAVMTLVNGFTLQHIAGKVQLPIEDVQKALATGIKIIQQKLEKYPK